MPYWLSWVALLLLAVMILKVGVTVLLAHRYHRNHKWLDAGPGGFAPIVAVVVPAYNEAPTIGTCVKSLASQTYPNLRVIVVDDGSDDGTFEAAESAADEVSNYLVRVAPYGQVKQGRLRKGKHRRGNQARDAQRCGYSVAAEREVIRRVPIDVLRKPNGGKASALNYGIAATPSEIVVCVDADCCLAPDAVKKLVEAFADPRVGAVGGVVKVAESRTLLGGQQAMEYVAGLTLQRAAFAQIGAVQVLSGAITAFRKDALRSVGWYSNDTIVEDFDLTVAIQWAGYRAILHPDAVAYTEGTSSLRDLMKQRFRWTYGGFQVLSKYRGSIFSHDMGSLSRVGLPYFLVFPWIDVLVSLTSAAILVSALLTNHLLVFLGYLLALSVPVMALNIYALRLAGDRLRLSLYGFLNAFFYAHVLTFTTARAGVAYVRGRRPEWAKLTRLGINGPADMPGSDPVVNPGPQPHGSQRRSRRRSAVRTARSVRPARAGSVRARPGRRSRRAGGRGRAASAASRGSHR